MEGFDGIENLDAVVVKIGHAGGFIEALRQELSYFVECITTGQEPFNNGAAGLRVVKMLEAASESLAKRGELVYL